MRLADFIIAHTEEILVDWESFARTLLPGSAEMDSAALRDHAAQILKAVTLDLRTAQTPQQQATKSRGEASPVSQSADTAAELHAVLRAKGGFTLQQLVAEYRALRASVLRQWTKVQPPGPDTLEDIMRFNEAIDQAVTESVDSFAIEVERWRNLFLGILSHDLRGPLNSILLTSQHLERLLDGTAAADSTGRLIRGAQRMRQLLDELLDYSRASLELGLPVDLVYTNLAVACMEEIEIQRAAWPSRVIEFAATGDTSGTWDASRLKQAVGNMVSNAAKYGMQDGTIAIRLTGMEHEVQLEVENAGPAIEPAAIEALFEPLRRGPDRSPDRTSLGLGLFIVRHIMQAHAGTVSADSAGGKTVFTLTLPRSPPVRR